MNITELRVTREALRAKLAELDRIRADCMSCRHLGGGLRCEHFGAVPPKEFQRQPEACEAWVYDEVPF